VRRLPSKRAFTPQPVKTGVDALMLFARYERAFTPVFARYLVVGAMAMLAGAPAAAAEALDRGRVQAGLASWYSGGGTFCGDRTVQPFTAAHRVLPCGALVRVTVHGRSVLVTIRDRGPFIKGRIIDLDRQAAAAVGLIGPGLLPVTVERIR
jgi:rare lipoprotein A (peptidoglycan hydrolase)